MRNDRFIESELLDFNSFLTMIETFEEISALRMRKVKKSVLARREYLQGLNQAFAYVAYAYQNYVDQLKKKIKTSAIDNNGRTAMLLLSSNTGLYGDIISRITNRFIIDVKKSSKDSVDVIITGRLGRTNYEEAGKPREYKYFELSDAVSNEAQVSRLMGYLISYANVYVYHGLFKSILLQQATSTYLTGEVGKIKSSLEKTKVGFLFEPSVDKIANYFEKQVLALIFEQTVFESNLSKFASRMVSLDSAASGISSRVKVLDFDLKKAKHKITNSNIQEILSGALS
jgi:ATP synthase F1 gamma subunit